MLVGDLTSHDVQRQPGAGALIHQRQDPSGDGLVAVGQQHCEAAAIGNQPIEDRVVVRSAPRPNAVGQRVDQDRAIGQDRGSLVDQRFHRCDRGPASVACRRQQLVDSAEALGGLRWIHGRRCCIHRPRVVGGEEPTPCPFDPRIVRSPRAEAAERHQDLCLRERRCGCRDPGGIDGRVVAEELELVGKIRRAWAERRVRREEGVQRQPEVVDAEPTNVVELNQVCGVGLEQLDVGDHPWHGRPW